MSDGSCLPCSSSRIVILYSAGNSPSSPSPSHSSLYYLASILAKPYLLQRYPPALSRQEHLSASSRRVRCLGIWRCVGGSRSGIRDGGESWSLKSSMTHLFLMSSCRSKGKPGSAKGRMVTQPLPISYSAELFGPRAALTMPLLQAT